MLRGTYVPRWFGAIIGKLSFCLSGLSSTSVKGSSKHSHGTATVLLSHKPQELCSSISPIFS